MAFFPIFFLKKILIEFFICWFFICLSHAWHWSANTNVASKVKRGVRAVKFVKTTVSSKTFGADKEFSTVTHYLQEELMWMNRFDNLLVNLFGHGKKSI